MKETCSFLADQPTLVVVLGDFGRDAALSFCSRLADLERDRLQGAAPGLFYDEYRRIHLALVGDLSFAKAPQLAPLKQAARPLDERIMVGFSGGIPPREVADRLGALALQQVAAGTDRGHRRFVIAIPCNTLAPVSWAMERRFRSVAALQQMLQNSGLADAFTEEQLEAVLERGTFSFPTVPQAVLSLLAREGATRVLPLGTLSIDETYLQAAERLGLSLEVISLEQHDQEIVLEAIQVSIGHQPSTHARALARLEDLLERARQEYGQDLAVIEACTDIAFGLGVDSNATYAAAVVEAVYRPARP